LNTLFVNAQIRLVQSSRVIDWASHLFRIARSELVVRFASEEFFGRYNEAVYGSHGEYVSGSVNFRDELFPWETQAIRDYFPPPPARVLIGGAGGGREAFALARMGYEVVAFEPSKGLVRSMADNISEGLRVDVYRSAYELLPILLDPRVDTPTASLKRMKPFDAAILGWGSFTHIRTPERRLQALASFGEVTNGPILMSFLSRVGHIQRLPQILSRVSPIPMCYDRGDEFRLQMGYIHFFNRGELLELADRAELRVECYYDGLVHSAHAILVPSGSPARQTSSTA
jgi:SAM-dependent methyltransferase